MANDIPTKIDGGSGASVKSEIIISTGSISVLTGSTLSTRIPTSTRRRKQPRWAQQQWQNITPVTTTDLFNGVNPDLENKVFTIGPDQAARYDNTVKAFIGYVSQKYDHRVTSCIQHKDKTVGKKLIVKPKALTKTDLDDTSKKKLDKNGEEWVM